MYNLQVKVTRVNKLVKYLEAKDKPLYIKRFRPNRQPCGNECPCRACKAATAAIDAIRKANPKAYRIVTPTLG